MKVSEHRERLAAGWHKAFSPIGCGRTSIFFKQGGQQHFGFFYSFLIVFSVGDRFGFLCVLDGFGSVFYGVVRSCQIVMSLKIFRIEGQHFLMLDYRFLPFSLFLKDQSEIEMDLHVIGIEL